MKCPLSSKVFFAVVSLTVLSLLAGGASIGQEKEKKAKGRLPPYYGDIVTETQRQTIYGIQAKYAAQIDALQKQLDTIEQQRDNEIEGVLNADQKARLKLAQEEAAAKKKKNMADKKADEGKESPAADAKPTKETKKKPK
jgi:hypothetical protein